MSKRPGDQMPRLQHNACRCIGPPVISASEGGDWETLEESGQGDQPNVQTLGLVERLPQGIR